MQARMSMITLGVKDLEKSIQFYQQGLGLPRRGEEKDVAFFNLNGTWLGLFGRDQLAEDAQVAKEGSGFNSFAIAHNVTSQDQVHEVLEEARRAGATIVKEAQEVFWGGYSGYFADPDGHLWEVAYNPFSWIGPENMANVE